MAGGMVAGRQTAGALVIAVKAPKSTAGADIRPGCVSSIEL